MQRLYVGRPDKVFAQFPAAPVGTVRFSATRHDGTVLVSNAPTANEGSNRFSYSLTAAHLVRVDQLLVTFKDDGANGVTIPDVVEIAGAPYFETVEVYNPVVSASSFSTAEVAAARLAVEDQIEANVGTSFVHRFAHYTMRSQEGAGFIALPQPFVNSVISIRADGVALAESQSIPPASGQYTLAGHYVWGSGFSGGGVRVQAEYVSGWSGSPPADIREAAIAAARAKLLESRRTGVQPQATVLSTEVGTMQLAVAGLRHPFGLPTVDAVVLVWKEALERVVW